MSASSAVMLPYALSSVAVARRHLYTDLRERGVYPASIDDVVLVVSELLSNALRHAHPLPSGQVQVAWRKGDGHVEVAVSDGGAATEPRAGRPALSSLGGRGLGIVEFVAERWGVDHDGETTTVWAVLPCVEVEVTVNGAEASVNGRGPHPAVEVTAEVTVLRDCC